MCPVQKSPPLGQVPNDILVNDAESAASSEHLGGWALS